MFVLCPHCHFLVGLDPRTGAPPARCPKCDRPLGDAREAPAIDVVPEVPGSAAPPPREQATAAGASQPASPERVTPEASSPSPSAAMRLAAAPAPASTPPQQQSASPPRLDADAMIAAMAAKAPRRAGPARKKIESAKAAPAATPGSHTPPADAPAATAATAPTRAQRGKRKSAPVPARQESPDARTPAEPQPQRPAAGPWWSALLRAWRARATAARARRDAKGAPAAAPAFDPLAASVRNRARNRRVAAESTPATAATPSASPAPPAASTDAPARPASAVATEPPRDGESAPLPAARIPPRLQAPAAAGAEPPRIEPTAPAPLQAEPATPDAPPAATTPETSSPVAEVQPAPAEAPFVERRRNPDVPIPPGTLPAHPLRRRTDAPSFARAQAAATARRHDWRWPVAVAALSLLLVLQLLLAQRDTLAADARWRPTVSALCTLLRCRLPAWREPDAFTMLSRDVRAHPSAPGALLINASFRNDAPWPQPWPRVLLTLSNVDGRIVGARAFAAREYLGADAATQHELAPGQTAAITLAVVEPAPDIVAFNFDFR